MLWKEKWVVELEADMRSLRSGPSPANCRALFHLPEDNLWPQRLYKSDASLPNEAILTHYKDVPSLPVPSQGR